MSREPPLDFKSMPVIVKVKSKHDATRMQREKAAQRVVSHFGLCAPKSTVLCFLDDENPPGLKRAFGAANRGIYGIVRDGDDLSRGVWPWPDYLSKSVQVDDRRVIDELIYLYDGTCSDDVGLTMTLAHELQHATQHDKERRVWAVNSLVRNLPTAVDELKLEWKDIPTELDARIVAKRVTRDLHGEEAVNRYIDKRASEATEPHEIFDWGFVRELAPSSSIDIISETHRLFHRLGKYRQEVEETLRKVKNNPDFADIDLDEFFTSSVSVR